MPVTQNGSYDVPVMARRDLHGEYRPYGSSSFSSSHSAFSSPQKFFSNVRSQLVNSYSAIRDRLTHHSSQQQGAPSLNSPSSLGGSRYTRSSSQSSTNGQGAGYNLRRRGGGAPVHSTPRDNDSDQQQHRKTSSKQRKDRKSRDGDEEEEENGEEEDDEKDHKHGKDDHDHKDNIIVRLIKRILHLPFDIISFVWHKFFGLPWWLLIPLLLFLGLYVCKSILSSSTIFSIFCIFYSSSIGM
jgi:hypothetical protein